MTTDLEEVKSSDFDLIVAIDFGTDGTALAFTTPNSNGKDIYIRQDWNEKDKHNQENFGVKMKTNILLNRIPIQSKFNDDNIFGDIIEEETKMDNTNTSDDNYFYQFIAFGSEARSKYQNKNIYDNSTNWLYFESFKMALFEGKCTKNEKVKINEFLISKNGIKVSSAIVFIESFKYIIRQVKLWIENHNNFIKLTSGLDSIKWIISVPAIWSDTSKHLMIEWFNLAGINRHNIIKDQIKLEYEPDCASISILNELRSNFKSKNLKKGDCYILLDLGGGTADFACHEVLDDNEVKEIYHPTGGAWGSTYIDIEFEKLLTNIFGKNVMKEFKTIYEADYMTLISNFVDECKLKFFYRNFRNKRLRKKFDKKSSHNVQLPLKFIEFLEEHSSIDDLDEFLNKYKYNNKSGLIELKNEYLALNYQIWFDLFDTSVDPIISHLTDLIDEISYVKYLILVGGFSESTYMQYRIIKQFGKESEYKLSTIIPKRPLLCVVDGAARLGLIPDFMSERVLSKSYGIGYRSRIKVAKQNGATDEFISKHTVKDNEGKEWVSNCFKRFVQKNQTIKRGQNVNYNMVVSTDGEKTVGIYCSSLENPYTCSKSQSKRIGSLVFPETMKKGDKIELEFYFSGTTIKVKVYLTKENYKQICETVIKYQTNFD